MEDTQIHNHIEALVAEEHRLLEHGDPGTCCPTTARRLEAVEVQLDRYWICYVKRRARRDAGQDPDVAHIRAADTVEHYKQ